MVQLDDMYTVYYLARANKRRSEDAVIFETNLEANLYHLTQAINERTYRANANYAFISTRPRPREVFGCEMESRLIQWYIVWRITPLIEKELTPRTFNNRKGMGTDAAIRQLQQDIREVSRNYTQDAYIIQWDLSGYFPSANCDIASRQLKAIANHYNGPDKEDILWMIDIAVHANPQRHCRLKSPRHMWNIIPKGKSILSLPAGKGGAIGFLIWQIAMNVYLNDIDHWLVDELKLHYVRFVDDSAIVVQNKACALALLPEIRMRYAQYEVIMHPKKFYCQHYSKGVQFLGTQLKFDRTYCNQRNIRNAKSRVWYFNQLKNKKPYINRVIATLNSFTGLLKHKCEYKNIKNVLQGLSPEWSKYITFNEDRLCIQPLKGYLYHDIVKHKYRSL